jgi:hypothetical protein
MSIASIACTSECIETALMALGSLDNKIEVQMRSAGVPQPTITSFLTAVHKLMAGGRRC